MIKQYQIRKGYKDLVVPEKIKALQIGNLSLTTLRAFTHNKCDYIGKEIYGKGATGKEYWCVHTINGLAKAYKEDFIIEGMKDEFYPCTPDTFHATYEAVK